MAIARKKNCATPNSIVEQFKTDFEAQWKRTTQSGEENGSLLFYEQATNTYPKVTLSEGRHVTDRITSVPAMPEIGPETRKAFDDFKGAGRNAYFLAFFHTHPNFPAGDSRSGNPSRDDIQYQSDLTELGINMRKFKKERAARDMVGSFIHTNERDGFGIEVVQGIVHRFSYDPRKRDRYLLCRNRTNK